MKGLLNRALTDSLCHPGRRRNISVHIQQLHSFWSTSKTLKTWNTNIYTLLQERKMPSGEEEARGLSMTFTSTSRHHSGFYTCSADNGFGRATNATITLDVQRKC